MSKVTIAGDVNGTGVFTIAAPNGNTNRTLTLPDATGTLLSTATPGVPVNGPTFFATLSANQSISNNVQTKLTFNTETFDTNNCFDTSTNRFTPTVAGYYQVNLIAQVAGTAGRNYVFEASLFKNGLRTIRNATALTLGTGQDFAGCVHAIMYMNGSGDYLEAYFYEYDYSAQGGVSASTFSTFSAALVRAA
jgi:hypothetical protein